MFGEGVEIEGADVARRGTFDGVLFNWREFGLQLVRDGLCDLALNREHIRKVAIISLPPQMPVGAQIDQLRVDANTIARALNNYFHDMRQPALLARLE